MDKKSAALKYLSRDQILHIDMLEALRHNQADILIADETGVLLRHHHRGLLLMSASDEQSARDILGSQDEADAIVARQDFCPALSDELLGLDYPVPCIQHAYLYKQPLPLPPIDAKVKPLLPHDLDFVAEHYSLGLDNDYILERLQKGAIYGIYHQGDLAGFAGFHAEGSMGMLEILPAWRRLGLGYYLQSYMTNLALMQGRIPYNQVKAGNEISLRLQKKGGFTAANQPVFWLLRSRD